MNGMASYCSKCGNEVADGTRFCPACGFDTTGQSVDNSGGSSQSNNQNYNQEKGSSGILTATAVLGIIWGLLAIFIGIVLVIGASLLEEFGFGEFSGMFVIAGVIYILSAIMGFVCAALIFSRKNFYGAWITCLVGSVLALVGGYYLGLLGIIAGIIGIVFFALMYNQKKFFAA